MTTEGTEGIRKSNRRWQSDVIVDLVKRYGFPYVTLNPGASFRGLLAALAFEVITGLQGEPQLRAVAAELAEAQCHLGRHR